MNVYFDPISTSQIVSAIITIIFFGLSFAGLWMVFKTSTSGEVRFGYGIIVGVLCLGCLIYSGCQTTGCVEGGNYDLVMLATKTADKTAHTQQLAEENRLLRAKIELLKIEQERGQPLEEEYGPMIDYKPHPQDTTP